MGGLRKVALAVYLLAGIVVAGGFAGSLFGPYTERFAVLFSQPVPRTVVAVCLVVVCLQMIVTLIRVLIDRPEPAAMRLSGNPDIEVSVGAVASVARVAASDDRDVMVEDVEARVVGRERDGIRVRVTAIALIDQGIEGLAYRLQQRVADACTSMLGTSGVTVQVRFLPSKTVTMNKEA